MLVLGSRKLAAMGGRLPKPSTATLQKIGEQLFNDHLVALEAAGLLLLAAMVAAALLVKRETK
jgi:NADH:ubiquinone oxidoreductase subunit 6 (subunit J)